MKTFLSTLILCLVCWASVAQNSSYQAGYYIDDQGVRHEGWIKYSQKVKYSDLPYFKISEEADAKPLRPEKTIELGLKKEEIFRSITFSSKEIEKTQFAQLLVRGPVSLYETWDSDQEQIVYFFCVWLYSSTYSTIKILCTFILFTLVILNIPVSFI